MATVGSKESTVSQLLVGFYSADQSSGSQLSATNFRQKIMRLQRRRRFHCLAFSPDSPSSETSLWPSSNLLCSSWLSPRRAHLIKSWTSRLVPRWDTWPRAPGVAASWLTRLSVDPVLEICWLLLRLPQHWGLLGKVSARVLRQTFSTRKNQVPVWRWCQIHCSDGTS